jgi:hypothetical protein
VVKVHFKVSHQVLNSEPRGASGGLRNPESRKRDFFVNFFFVCFSFELFSSRSALSQTRGFDAP